LCFVLTYDLNIYIQFVLRKATVGNRLSKFQQKLTSSPESGRFLGKL